MKKHYKFKLSRTYSYAHPFLEGVTFKNDWCQIEGGVLTINSEYAWDGCSHKFFRIGKRLFGTPDGVLVDSDSTCVNILTGENGWAETGKASLVHDVLTQFRSEIPLTQRYVTQIFNDMLHDVHWQYRPEYVYAVDRFGPQDFMV